MDQETSTAKAVRLSTDRMYDEACKRLFAEKEILAWIMQLTVDECKDLSPREIIPCIEGTPEIGSVAVMPDETNAGRIHGSNTEDSTVTEGTVFYDIRFDAMVPGTEEKIKLILNVESQNDTHPGYPLTKRALYYCARLLSAQNGIEFKNSEYGKIKKVYSIWIVSHPPKDAENTVTEYTIQETCKIGNTTVQRKEYDVLKAIFLYLGDLEEDQKNDALRLLDILRSGEMTQDEKITTMGEDFKIPMTETMNKEVVEMCNWSKGVREEGRAEGRAEGDFARMLKVFMKMLRRGAGFDEAAEIAGAETEEERKYLREHMPA